MLVRYGFAIVAAALGLHSNGLEVDLEWEIGQGTKGISTAMSLLRFANDTAPPATEWTPLGWTYGSMSLQHRLDKSTYVSMQVVPPSANHQVILGKMSDIADVKYQPTQEGPSQVFLETKVDLDAALPYYFKVEAHHDLKQNRTTYEGLFSTGNHWLYMGSLVLQHPIEKNDTRLVATKDDQEESLADTESNISSDASENGLESSLTTSSNDKNESESEKESKSASSREKDVDSDSEKKSTSADNSGSESESDDGNESDKDSDTDGESDSEDSKRGRKESADTQMRYGASTLRRKQMYASPADAPDGRSHRPLGPGSFDEFMHSGFEALKSRKLTEESMQPASTDAALETKDSAELPLSLLKNAFDFPDFVVFPKIYSGIKRMESGDASLLRAGIYKKFQLRDRLGETFFISKGHAFSYDTSDNDITSVRHFYMSASYLLSIDGTRNSTEESTTSESTVSDNDSKTSETSKMDKSMSETTSVKSTQESSSSSEPSSSSASSTS
ncbi:hypothetical protein GGI07_004825 [Coemansia sp. Benny D115]|nr:hypothetical protein GGI07_004825 [Coemansia sp. Benny D115]